MKKIRTIYLSILALIVALGYLIATPAYSFVEDQSVKIHASEVPNALPEHHLFFLQKPHGKAAINTAKQVPVPGFENTEDEDQRQSSFKKADSKRLAVYLFNYSKNRFNSQNVSKLIFPFHTYL